MAAELKPALVEWRYWSHDDNDRLLLLTTTTKKNNNTSCGGEGVCYLSRCSLYNEDNVYVADMMLKRLSDVTRCYATSCCYLVAMTIINYVIPRCDVTAYAVLCVNHPSSTNYLSLSSTRSYHGLGLCPDYHIKSNKSCNCYLLSDLMKIRHRNRNFAPVGKPLGCFKKN